MDINIFKKIKKYLELPNGFYLANNKTIGDAYGPMSAGRYQDISTFYEEHKNAIDNADELVKEYREKEAYYSNAFRPKTKAELCQYIKEKQERYGIHTNLCNIDTSLITDMSYLFKGCDFVGDISNWDVSNVTDMSYMFEGVNILSELDKWNVSNVVNMQGMFKSASINKKIAGWNVSNVTDMSHIFENATVMSDISSWQLTNVKNMACAFLNAITFGNVTTLKMPNCIIQDLIFHNTHFIGAVNKWDKNPCPESKDELIDIVKYRLNLFWTCMNPDINWSNTKSELVCDLNDIDTHLITDMSYLFTFKKFLYINISKWDVSNVLNFAEMFSNSDFNSDISNWNINVKAVTTGMFRNCNIDDKYKPNNSIKNNVLNMETNIALNDSINEMPEGYIILGLFNNKYFDLYNDNNFENSLFENNDYSIIAKENPFIIFKNKMDAEKDADELKKFCYNEAYTLQIKAVKCEITDMQYKQEKFLNYNAYRANSIKINKFM
ncbi:MAG: hypothetical protein [Wendovervirus sonii]|uniref:BspA family leucine-rich repeat surface protein n=1 Tax=phage Lak_Megaphage_Sonny TaxID=3109229 RepID=A0ABZ0Z5Y0_9CAUD|nr:MAG: hypothetical protein [phage Lak_Megaphage_Sonny]